jgi:beta-glucosidase
MDGLKAEFPNAAVTFVPGTQFLRTDGTPVPDAVLSTPDGKPGLTADYNEGMRRGPPAPGANTKPIVSRTESNVKLTESNVPAEIAAKKTFGVQWSGFLTPTETGDFLLGIRCEGFGRLSVDGKQVAMAFGGGTRGLSSGVGRVHLEKGHKVALEISYGTRNSKPHAELIWARYNGAPSQEAITAAKNADAVIAVVGITSQLEGEEMPVSEPGFLGGDRTSIDLPQPEEELVEAVAATGNRSPWFS